QSGRLAKVSENWQFCGGRSRVSANTGLPPSSSVAVRATPTSTTWLPAASAPGNPYWAVPRSSTSFTGWVRTAVATTNCVERRSHRRKRSRGGRHQVDGVSDDGAAQRLVDGVERHGAILRGRSEGARNQAWRSAIDLSQPSGRPGMQVTPVLVARPGPARRR